MKLNQPVFVFTFHIVLVIVLLVLGSHAAIGDWGNYYYGSHAFIGSVDTSYIYDPTTFNNYVDSWHGEKSFLNYTQVPPLSLLIYLPFALFKVGTAKLVFISLTYLLCLFTVTRLFKKLKIDGRWSLLLPLIFFLPFRSNIDSGQSYFLLIALLAGGWLARENKKWIIAAFLFAFAIHLKIFPAIVLLWFLAEKDWKMFGATLCATVIILLSSLSFIDWKTWSYYSAEVLPRLAKGEITNTYATAYQSMLVFLRQLFVPDALHNPAVLVDSSFLFQLGTISWSGIVLCAAFLFSWDKKQSPWMRFSVWIFAGMLISGYGSTYGLLLLMFPAIAIIHHQDLSSKKKFALLVLLMLIANIPVNWLLHLSLPFSFLRLMLVVLFFAGFIYFFQPKWNKLALVAFLLPLFSLLNAKPKEDESSYLLKKEPSLLITFFSENEAENKILYYYRTADGMKKDSFAYPGKIEYAEAVKAFTPHHISCNGKDFYFPGERITNPLLINGKTLLYLSDKNRGVGFYTIRKMEIR